MKKSLESGRATSPAGAAALLMTLALLFSSCSGDKTAPAPGGGDVTNGSTGGDNTGGDNTGGNNTGGDTTGGNNGGAVVVGAAVQAVACPESGAVDVAMQNNTFVPGSLSAPPDTVVRWTNYDATTTHSVTSSMVPENGEFSSSSLGMGESVCFKFTTPGTYNYYCSDHMAASLTIE